MRVRGIRKDASRGKLEDGLGEERAFVRVLGMSDALSEGVEDLTVYHGVHSVERVRRVGFEIEPVDRRLYERTQKAIADDVTLRRQRARGLRARAHRVRCEATFGTDSVHGLLLIVGDVV